MIKIHRHLYDQYGNIIGDVYYIYNYIFDIYRN
jgi:hypothetical protein